MMVNIATVEDLESLKREMVEELRAMVGQASSAAKKRWLKTEEVMHLLELSASTLQNLRRNGTLPFSRIGAIIYYDIEDINGILEARKTLKRELVMGRVAKGKTRTGKVVE